MKNKKKAIFYAILAAALYAINAPVSKLLLSKIPSTMMAGLLYWGAGIGMYTLEKLNKHTKELPLTKKELPYTVAMVLLDIAAPIFLMIGLNRCSAANASLLNNFEIVATSLIALFIFKETISKRLWLEIILVTISSTLLSFLLGERFFQIGYLLLALILGFVAYGLSIYFYIYAQRDLGAAKTSTYYAISPFIGAVLSLIIFSEIPSLIFIIALSLMAVGTYFASKDAF